MSTHNLFLSKSKKNNVFSCKPQLYFIEVGFKAVKIIFACFRDKDYRSLVKVKNFYP